MGQDLSKISRSDWLTSTEANARHILRIYSLVHESHKQSLHKRILVSGLPSRTRAEQPDSCFQQTGQQAKKGVRVWTKKEKNDPLATAIGISRPRSNYFVIVLRRTKVLR